jgi:ATP-dependent DNA helicase RecG
MAPTEILAEQHYLTFKRLLARCPYSVGLFTSAVKGKERRAAGEALAAGEVQIAVGTHALIQQDVAFHRLGLAVVDEQHRFGVLQREDLRRKGGDVDVLVMTATPIPRTLALTAYGDLDVSVVDERPPGRTPIRTVHAPPPIAGRW